ncbi:MAG: DUF3054 domain-containing protein [Nocardioidaceae bacterium]
MTLRDGRGVTFDVLAVLVFVSIGRLQHDGADGFDPLGFATTLWPFLGGLGIALVVQGVTPGVYRGLPVGAAVVAATVVGGLCLRYASGQGMALSFAVVTAIVIGVLMLGWRLALARLT